MICKPGKDSGCSWLSSKVLNALIQDTLLCKESVKITTKTKHGFFAGRTIMPSVAVGSDHAGYFLKQELMRLLQESGYALLDLGAQDTSPQDYPDVRRLNKVRQLEEEDVKNV